MKEALKLALEALETGKPMFDAYWGGSQFDNAITAIKEALREHAMYEVQRLGQEIQPEQEPEFVTHNVDKPYDWSEWVCPNPSGYLMKCCDCGLVHEAEFGVVRYKSETEREDCDMVNDPNLQAVFRMRRSEEWSPKDTAYRPGGLAQPAVQQGHEQEPVAWGVFHFGGKRDRKLYSHCDTKEQAIAYIADRHQSDDTNTFRAAPLYTTPTQRTWVGLTDEEIVDAYDVARVSFKRSQQGIRGQQLTSRDSPDWHYAKAIEAKLKEKNT